ncbi:ABC transporter permease [Myceligenerans xiligouense]|uniref:Monosaccharide ABC transporter membrane protein (CUT2 family) n=1 Tax=Myceligenerans xiligouense TaxID=253184 RepID=A0A3N4ZPV9_9MICO|nr:ABC transporter permease [Myceligenerans xiligouense]RPF23015.1 monosaccharide ABC transporter membrane protein (CUT2 family) [Myceligenerans xiligouense]
MRQALRHHLFWPVAALVVLVVANTIAKPSFLSVTVTDGHLFGAPVDILRAAAPLLLIALGMTLVIATRGIDLSVGAVVAVSGAVALEYISASSDPGSPVTVLVAVGIALGLSLLLGLWNGFLVTVLGIQPIIATLILMTAGRGVAMLITGGFITTVTSEPYKGLNSGFFLGLPAAIWIAVGLFVVVAVTVRRTALGMLLEATGINPAASRLAGVRSRTLTWTVYAACGLLAGLAGILVSADTMAADANNAGIFIELDAILAVVIGGTALSGGKFNLSGTFAGVLVIATLERTVTVLGISPHVTPLFMALVVVTVTLLQSPRVRERFAVAAIRRRPVPDGGRGEAVEMSDDGAGAPDGPGADAPVSGAGLAVSDAEPSAAPDDEKEITR